MQDKPCYLLVHTPTGIAFATTTNITLLKGSFLTWSTRRKANGLLFRCKSAMARPNELVCEHRLKELHDKAQLCAQERQPEHWRLFKLKGEDYHKKVWAINQAIFKFQTYHTDEPGYQDIKLRCMLFP